MDLNVEPVPINLLALGMNNTILMPSLNVPSLMMEDGGGIRGLSELVILDEIMRRIKHDLGLVDLPRPCDYFHLIGGTSTGG